LADLKGHAARTSTQAPAHEEDDAGGASGGCAEAHELFDKPKPAMAATHKRFITPATNSSAMSV